MFSSIAFAQTAPSTPWQPAKGPLLSRFAKDLDPANVLPEYPRPQMVREQWQNLNGLWDYAIRPRDAAQPPTFDGKILVPFPIESALSGVMKTVGENNRLWYRRTFDLPANWSGNRTLLHFGAVDWQAAIFLNGKQVGTHEGGYGEFTLDITDALKPTGPQELLVAVYDPTDAGTQPRGKQVNRPSGIWYTSVTGIWQTVWLEAVPQNYIQSLDITPDVDAQCVHITAHVYGNTEGLTLWTDSDAVRIMVTGEPNKSFDIPVPGMQLWSPDDPHLYSLTVRLIKDRNPVDTVNSYFAMRKVSLVKDDHGILRLGLNNKPLFQVGPLDQGWWPDGLYTAPTDAALKSDIEITKQLGFNMARKHVKVEPDRWYYWADKLGLLVWQDMPSAYATRAPNAHTAESNADFDAELKEMIDQRRNHPSIVMWVPFNEGWGQHDTERVVEWIKKYDPTRLVDNASGWTDRNVGDVHDVHVYPGPQEPVLEEKRAAVIGEFGGLGLPVAGHTWQSQANWSYRGFTTADALTDAYVDLMAKVHPLIGEGLSAAVYTQTTDVEIEINGLLTYDRAMVKGNVERIRAANQKLFTPPPPVPKLVMLLPTSQTEAQQWRYTTTAPGETWMKPEFDDTAWKTGPGGFGTANTPGTTVRTTWNTGDIWIRRTFDVPEGLKNPVFVMYHDEDAEVYINGEQALKVTGYITSYERTPLTPAAAKLLKVGKNTIAVHCHQTTGGQYIDVGIGDLVPTTRP